MRNVTILKYLKSRVNSKGEERDAGSTGLYAEKQAERETKQAEESAKKSKEQIEQEIRIIGQLQKELMNRGLMEDLIVKNIAIDPEATQRAKNEKKSINARMTQLAKNLLEINSAIKSNFATGRSARLHAETHLQTGKKASEIIEAMESKKEAEN